MKAPYADVTETLTRSELESPFLIGEIDDDPLPNRTRLALEWDGDQFVEFDPWGQDEGMVTYAGSIG